MMFGIDDNSKKPPLHNVTINRGRDKQTKLLIFQVLSSKIDRFIFLLIDIETLNYSFLEFAYSFCE